MKLPKKKKEKNVTLTDKPNIKVSENNCYKAINGKYFTDEYAYVEWKRENLYRERIIDNLAEVLGYEEGMKLPSFLFKKIKELDGYYYEAIYLCLMDKIKDIRWALGNKNFKSEPSRISYVMAIISNNVLPYHKAVEIKIKREKSERKNIIEEENLIIENKKQNTKDISKWLEE